LTKNKKLATKEIRGHALKRLRERFHVSLTYGQYESICHKIRCQEFVPLGAAGEKRLFYGLNFKGIDVVVVWDIPNKMIITFLTEKQYLVDARKDRMIRVKTG